LPSGGNEKGTDSEDDELRHGGLVGFYLFAILPSDIKFVMRLAKD